MYYHGIRTALISTRLVLLPSMLIDDQSILETPYIDSSFRTRGVQSTVDDDRSPWSGDTTDPTTNQTFRVLGM